MQLDKNNQILAEDKHQPMYKVCLSALQSLAENLNVHAVT